MTADDNRQAPGGADAAARPGPPERPGVRLPEVDKPDRTRLSVGVAEQLKQMIRDGELQPGDRLPSEAALCDHFGVSRITLREAIQMLRALGPVEPTRGRGTFVREPDPESFLRDLAYFAFAEAGSVQDLFEVRGLLEARAAERAASRGDLEERKALVRMLHDMADIVRDPDPARLSDVAQLDTQFHLRIAAVSRNLVLEQLMHRLMQILEAARARSLSLPGQPERSWAQHLAIAEAIAEGRPELAMARVIEHMETVKQAIISTDPTV